MDRDWRHPWYALRCKQAQAKSEKNLHHFSSTMNGKDGECSDQPQYTLPNVLVLGRDWEWQKKLIEIFQYEVKSMFHIRGALFERMFGVKGVIVLCNEHKVFSGNPD